MRGLFRWAVKAKLVKSDPTAGVDNPPRPKTDGFPVWTDDDIAVYGARWPIGTQQRVWLDVLVYTGLRRGDAVRFGRQHIRNGVGTIKTEKTDTVVTLPILPVLSKTLDAGPCGDLTFIAGENGRPLTKELLSAICFARHVVKQACRTARRMDCARPQPPGRRMLVLRLRSSKRSSAGTAGRWRRSTPELLIGADWRWRRCLSCRTSREQSIPSPEGKVREFERIPQRKQ